MRNWWYGTGGWLATGAVALLALYATFIKGVAVNETIFGWSSRTSTIVTTISWVLLVLIGIGYFAWRVTRERRR